MRQVRRCPSSVQPAPAGRGSLPARRRRLSPGALANRLQALRRELIEELGITIRNGTPWRTIEHVYPHAHVQLHFIIVTAWDGEPHGREAQALHWQKLIVTDDGIVRTPSTEPILPATLPLLADLAQLGSH